MAQHTVVIVDGEILEARVKQKVDTEPNWLANDITILDGEQAFVVNDNNFPVNFKIGDGTKKFSELPYFIGGAILPSGTPFKVNSTSPNVVIGSDYTQIIDFRLVNKSNYPIITTQLNVIFRSEDVTYSPINGTVTINNFVLNAGEEISLFPGGEIQEGGDGGLVEILNRLTELEKITAILKNGLVRIWFTGTVSQIPAGYVEDEPWRGRVPLHYNPSYPRFATINGVGGFEKITLTKDQIPPVNVGVPYGDMKWGDNANTRPFIKQDGDKKVYATTDGGGQSHDNMPPYKIGMWIKYVGG